MPGSKRDSGWQPWAAYNKSFEPPLATINGAAFTIHFDGLSAISDFGPAVAPRAGPAGDRRRVEAHVIHAQSHNFLNSCAGIEQDPVSLPPWLSEPEWESRCAAWALASSNKEAQDSQILRPTIPTRINV